MAPVNQPKILRSLAEEAVYQCIQRRVFGTTPAAKEKALAYVRFRQKYSLRRQVGVQAQAHTNFAQTLAALPAKFLKDCIYKLFEAIAVETYNKDFQELTLAVLSGAEPDLEQSMKSHIKKRLDVICMHVLSPKITSIDLSPISNEIFHHLRDIFDKSPRMKDLTQNMVGFLLLYVKLSKCVFFDIFLDWSDSWAHVTSLTIKNHASPELLWIICCTCPLLRHLNLAGQLCDYIRYCDYFTRIDLPKSELKDFAEMGDSVPEFIEALSGIYGSNRGNQVFKNRSYHLKELRTLILPHLKLEGRVNQDKLAIKAKNIMQKCVNLEELSNVNLIKAIKLMNQEKQKVPRILNLKKFHVSWYQEEGDNVESELQKVKLPRVQDVTITLFDDVTLLANFPNMKELRVMPPLGSSGCSLASILPYLRNLHTFRLNSCEVLSLDDVFNIAEQCPCLEYFSLQCLGLYNEITMRAPQHIINGETASGANFDANANEVNNPSAVDTDINELKIPPSLAAASKTKMDKETVKLSKDAKVTSEMLNSHPETEKKPLQSSDKCSETRSVSRGGKTSGQRENPPTQNTTTDQHEKLCPWRDSDGWQRNLDFMERWMKTGRAEYEDDPSRIPKFSRLRTLEIDEIENLDLAALYKCIRGSPNLHTFIYVAMVSEETETELINDMFVYKISQIMPRVKHVSLEGMDTMSENESKVSVLENLTCTSVKHLVDNCNNIQTIEGMSTWSMKQEEVDYLNDKFKKQNLILRLVPGDID